jgi:predicted MPP superfamily phosphohydrolase
MPFRNRLLTLLGLAALGSAVYAHFIEPNWLEVRVVPLKLPRLPAAFHHFRIVHISDFHLGNPMAARRLLRAAAAIQRIEPDMIAITGDFIHKRAYMVRDDLLAALQPLEAPDGVFAVMGNLDHSSGAQGLREVLQSSHILELNNAVHTIHRGDAQLHIAGVDDPVFRQDDLDSVLDQLPARGAAILLAHVPDYADFSAATGRFDLQLSGHSHGGQIRLPLIGPPVLPSYGNRYPAGQYQIGSMMQYTNRGLGTIFPHVRLNVRPEISVILLESPAVP